MFRHHGDIPYTQERLLSRNVLRKVPGPVSKVPLVGVKVPLGGSNESQERTPNTGRKVIVNLGEGGKDTVDLGVN